MNCLFQYEQAQTRTDLRTSDQEDQKTKRQSKIYFPSILYIIGLVVFYTVYHRSGTSCFFRSTKQNKTDPKELPKLNWRRWKLVGGL